MTANSDADRNLLFGVLALQVDLIDGRQFADACAAWAARRDTSLAELLVERGWLTPEDRADVERLLQRKLRKHGDARASLAAAAAVDPDVRRSLAGTPDAAASPLVATMGLEPRQLDRYTLTTLHATGGIGQVWLARDQHLGRDVALKELRPDRDHDVHNRGRFLLEAQITGQLEHPGVVPVYELARRPDTGQPFYTMRFVRGRTLCQAASDYHQKRCTACAEDFALPALLNAFVTVCHTVAYAHSRGVIHRDLKGQNVILGDFGEVIVLDWGLAKLVDRPEQPPQTPPVSPVREATGSDLTAAGQTLGTPAYMAPEQAAGRLDLINERTDVYGLGALLYELLTGQPPFTSPNVREVLREVQEDPPPPPRTIWPHVPPGLEAICLRALAKDQAARWASATELGQAVQGWQDAQRRQAEEALRASEERYRTLAEAVPHIVWTARPDGLLDYVNRRGFEYSGMTSAEAMGEAWQKMVHPDDLSVSLERWRSALATGNEYEVEFRLRRCDGTFRWFLSRAVPIRDAEGRIVKWFGTCTDIDDQKRVEAALRASEEQYHLLADAVPQIVWAADREGRNTFWNQRGHEYSGLSGADAAGAGWQAVMHPDDLPRLVENWQESVRTGRPQDFEFRLRRADGVYRWFLGRAVPVRDGQGQIVKWIGTCTDINDKKCPRQLT